MRPHPLREDPTPTIEDEAPSDGDGGQSQLEAADALVPLERAAQLGGIGVGVLTDHAGAGRLRAMERDGAWWTTRRWLHIYLLNDLGDHRDRPLPAGYVAPDGEPRRKIRHYLVK